MAYHKKNKWTDEENDFLRSNAPTMTVRQIRAALIPISPKKRSEQVIRNHLAKLELKPVRVMSIPWGDEQLTFLLANHGKMRPIDIAKAMGVSYSYMYNKMKNLDLTVGLKQVSEWRATLRSLDDIAYPLHDAGVRLEIREKKGLMAVFASRSLEEIKENGPTKLFRANDDNPRTT